MSKLLRAGVAGAGSFGRHHARIYAGLPGISFAGVYDPHLERAQALAGEHGGRGFDEMAALLAQIDILTIASPATTHAAIALAALRAGKAVYVEKPIATTLADADKLNDAAAKAAVVLACGLQERVASRAMGPAGRAGDPDLSGGRAPRPWGPRNADVSCVLDLMIHDIDLALTLNHAEPLAVEAEGRVTKGPLIDEARAEITLDDGSTIILEALPHRRAP